MERPQRKKVLIVSYFFPPANTIGAVRVGKFAKYLQDFGWEPWVLTLEKGVLNLSEDLPVEISEAHVVRAGFGRFAKSLAGKREASSSIPGLAEPSSPQRTPRSVTRSIKRMLRWVAARTVTDARLPDRALPWYAPAIKKGDELLRSQAFDAILSSHGPPGSDIVASILSHRHGIPWVADFRDLWTQNHAHRGRLGLVHWPEEQIERVTMRHARELVTVSAPLAAQLESLHHKRVTVIPNGFDESDYEPIPEANGKLPCRLVYTGMIYEGEQDPSPLFLSVAELVEAGAIRRDEVAIEFYGTNSPFVLAKAAEAGISDMVSMFARVPHNEVRRRQLTADILLLLDWTDPKVKGYYSAKVFEYLGARKPILAVGPKGTVIAELMEETSAGAHASNAHEAKAALLGWMKQRSTSGAIDYRGDAVAISRYTRRSQTQALAAVLNRVVASPSRVIS